MLEFLNYKKPRDIEIVINSHCSLQATYIILGECPLISNLPGKALRTLVDITRLAERFNMRSQSRAS